MDAEEAPKSAVVPDEATIAKATVEMLTGDAEVVAAYGAGTLTVRVLMTAVAGKLAASFQAAPSEGAVTNAFQRGASPRRRVADGASPAPRLFAVGFLQSG